MPKLVPAKNYKGESVDFFYVDSPAFTVLQGGKLMPMIEPSIEKNDGIEPPIFPGCKKVAVQERLACMSSGISEILNRHVKRGSVPAGRVNILITVGPSGKIGEIKSLGSANEALSDELKRVLHYLPEMVPAIDKNGGAVEYKMFVPITLLNKGPFD